MPFVIHYFAKPYAFPSLAVAELLMLLGKARHGYFERCKTGKERPSVLAKEAELVSKPSSSS